MDKYPEIERWFETCKALPGFAEVERGANGLATRFLEKVGPDGLND